MRQRKTRHHHSKDIAPVVRSTFDGRPLLPGEVPIVAAEPAPAAAADPLRAALAMFDDMLSRPAPRVAVPVDRWGMLRAGDSGPVLLESAVQEVLQDEPTEQAAGPSIDIDMSFDEWGDAAGVIEEWFRTGEFELPDPAAEDEPATWFGGLVRRVRRAWSGPVRPDTTAWDLT